MGGVWFLGLGADRSLPFNLSASLYPLPFPPLSSLPPLALEVVPFPPFSLPVALPSRLSSSLLLEVGPHIQLGGLGERCKLPQRGLSRSPSRNRIWYILAIKYDVRWQQF